MKVVERAAPEPVRRADPPPAPAPEPRREAPPPQPRRFAVSMDALVPGGAGGVAVPVTEGRTAARGDPGAPASAPVGDNVPFATRPVDATEVERPPTVLRPFTAAELRDVYPEEARREGLEADVRVELLVSEAGAVVDLKVPRRAGNGFDEAARTLARRIAFRPAERNGRAVAVWIPFTIKFRLDG
jgi:TonB family protein